MNQRIIAFPLMKENCGVIAVVDLAGKQDVVPLAAAIARDLEHRGELAAGMTVLRKGGKLETLKDMGRVRHVLSDERLEIANLMGHAAIAHTRYATNAHRDLTQPFQYEEDESPKSFAIAFNGNIANLAEMRERLVALGHAPKIEGDTEIIGRTIIEGMYTHGKNMGKVLQGLNVLDGSFNIVMIQQNGSVYAIRDPHGFHPMVYAQKESIVAVASEDRAIHHHWPRADILDIPPGHMLNLSVGKSSVQPKALWMAEPSLCFFEAVYFADHRSHIDGVSVGNARRECGKILAEMDMERPGSDIVVPVPESAKIAANGYADTRRLRRVDGILRNHDVGRTFTSAEDRLKKATLKYDIDDQLLRGRSIILVDDSLVRGTTLRVLAKQLRDKGAQQIHLRLASPPIISPCFYGIDFPTVSELLARKYSDGRLDESGVLPDDALAAMAADLGVDSIKYLPINSIPRAMGKKRKRLCMACVTRKYPTSEGLRLAVIAEEKACGSCGGCGS